MELRSADSVRWRMSSGARSPTRPRTAALYPCRSAAGLDEEFVKIDRGGLLQLSGTCTVSFMCLRLATMVKVMITSSDHELHLLKCTVAQAPSWCG